MIYARATDAGVHLSFSSVDFQNNFFTIYSVENIIPFIFACLNKKKEVFIFRDLVKDVSFSKGHHFKICDDYIYLNPSIRNKLKDTSYQLKEFSFSSLGNHLNSLLNS